MKRIAIVVAVTAMAYPAARGEWSITAAGDAYRIKAGQLERTLELGGRNVATSAIAVDGVGILAGPAKELSVRFHRADPDRKPEGLKAGQGGEINSAATFGKAADERFAGQAGGADSDVRWVEPLALAASSWAATLAPARPEVTRPAAGITRLALASSGAKGGPLEGMTIRIVYEIYKGHSAIRKWVEFTNAGAHWLKIDRLVIDDVAVAKDFSRAVALTPSEGGAASSIVALGSEDGGRGVIVCSEVPSALRHLGATGDTGYAADLFEWVLGSGETFVSEPVFQYAYAGPVHKTVSGVSTPLDRTVEGPYMEFLRKRVGVAADAAPFYAPAWCTWSNFGPAVDDAIIRRQADLAAKAGFAVLQIDDGWQRDRLGTEPDPVKFPDFAATCRHVRSRGLALGLWVSCFRSSDARDFAALPGAAVVPAVRRLTGLGMAFASPWRAYYAADLASLRERYGAVYFKQDFTNIKFGDIAAGHESRTRKESLLRGLRGLLEAQDLLRRRAPDVANQISHEIYWGTPGVPSDLAAIKHAASFHAPPNDYSGCGCDKKRLGDEQYPAALRAELLRGCFAARQRFYAHRGLPPECVEYFAAATFSLRGSLTPEIQDRQVCSWLVGAPRTFSGDLATLTPEHLERYRRRFEALRRLQEQYGIYRRFQFSGVPAPTDTDWHWWGKLNEQGLGAVVVVRGSGAEERRAVNIPWVHADRDYVVTALLGGRPLGRFTGRQLQEGALVIPLPPMGQEILELAPQ